MKRLVGMLLPALMLGVFAAPLIGAGVASAVTGDGTGTMTAAPTSVPAGSSNVQLVFTFTATANLNGEGAEVSVALPAGWTAPSLANTAVSGCANPGPGNNLRPKNFTGGTAGPWTITIPTTCTAAQSFTLTYGGMGSNSVTAPSSAGSSTFTTESMAGGSGSSLVAITTSPVVNVNASSSTTLSGVTSPVTYNAETQTLSAVVTGQSGDGNPLGTVAFQYAGPTTICATSTVASSTLTTTTYGCSLTASQLAAGTYAVTAVYAPGTPSSSDTNYSYDGSSSSAQYIVVNPGTGLTVNFVPDGGAAVAPVLGNYNTAVTLPSDTQTGYIFDGWFTASSGGTQVTSPDTLTTSTTLYAQWTLTIANPITVTFNSNDGANSTTTESAPSDVATPLTANGFTNAGYSFSGWNTTANDLGTAYANGANITATSDVTLYAQWTSGTETVTFNANGGVGTMANETEVSGVATELSDNAFTRDKFFFAGWNTQPDGSGTTYQDGAIYPFTASATLYAQWSNDHTLESLLADPSWANNAAVTPGETMSIVYLDDSPIDGNGKYNLPTVVVNGQLVPVTVSATLGYPLGNYVNPQFGGSGSTHYEDLLTFTLPSTLATGTNAITVTVYDGDGNSDQWSSTVQTENDTVTFASDGGAAVAPVSSAYNTAVALPSDTEIGYTFNGWFTSSTGGTLVTSPDTVMSSTTLYAQWTVDNYAVTYANGGGTGTLPTEANVNFGSTFPVASGAGLAKPGYTFAGWNDGTSTYLPGALYSVGTSPVSLTAQWSPVNNTVTFNSEGGSAVTALSGPEGSTITLPAAPTYAGNTFNGWFTAATGGGALTSPYTLSGSSTLYAQWTANSTNTVTFNSEGGSAVTALSGPEGSTITLPAAPTYAGNTFNGWFTAATGGGALTSPYTLSGSSTLYAQWTAATTTAATNVTFISATLNGTINPDGASITTTGFCYSTSFMVDCSGSPSIVSASPSNPTGTSAVTVTANVASLERLSQFFYQTFATNSSGVTTYGAIVTFATGYTVVYNPEGGLVSPTHVNVEPGQTIMLGTATYPGYSLVAWNTAQYGGLPVGTEGDVFNPEYPQCPNYPANSVCSDTTENTVPVVALYATWSTNTYTVTYNAGTGSVSVASPCTQTSSPLASCSYITGSPNLTLPTPTLVGSTFEGWNTASNFTGTDVHGGTYAPTSSIILYAQWTTTPATYTVSFNPDSGLGFLGGSGTITAMSGNEGSRIILPGDTGFTPPTGYSTFAGWSTTESSASVRNVVDYHTNSSYTLSANVTLYAVWLSNSTGGNAPVFTSTFADTFSYGVGGTEQVFVTGAPTITLSASITGADDSQLQPGDVTLAYPGTGSCAGSCVDGTLTVSASTVPGTYVVVFTAQNSFGINTQIYTFNVESPYAPTKVVATTDLTAANTVYVSWVAPTKGTVVSYDVTPTDASPGAGSGTLTMITGISPATSCSGSGISGLCFVVSGPAGNDTLIGGDTYDFVVTAVFDSKGTESSATSNYTLPTVVSPSGSTGANAVGTDSSSQSGSSTASVGSLGSSGYVSATAVGQGVVSVGSYDSNPAAGAFSPASGSAWYDVAISPGSQFSSVSFEICGVGSNGAIDWYDSLNGQSYAVAPAPVAVSGSPTCYSVSLDATSVPTSTDETLYGSLFFVPSTSGGGGGSSTPAVATAPTIPQDVIASPGDTTATVTWSTPVSDGGSVITGYIVTSGPGGFTCTVSEPIANTCVVSGLTNGTTYTFSVVAINSAGNGQPGGPSNPVVPSGPSNPVVPSGPSNPVVPGSPSPPVSPAVATAPTIPQDVIASPGDTTATVTWSTPVSDGGSVITGYIVTSGPGGFTCTVSEPIANTCVVSGLTNGTTYTFSVVAINSAGNGQPGGPSNPVVPKGPKPPAKKPPVKKPPVKKPLRVIVTLDPFVTGSIVLLPKMKSQLMNLAKLIKRDVGTSVSITGFTDSRDSASYNYVLGLGRAKSACKFLYDELRTLHVKVDFPVAIVSKGLKSAAASNLTAAGQAKNRRVALIAWLR